jgi:hypothetical protein
MPDGKTQVPEGKIGFIRPKRIPSPVKKGLNESITTGSKIFQDDEKYIDFNDLEPLNKV